MSTVFPPVIARGDSVPQMPFSITLKRFGSDKPAYRMGTLSFSLRFELKLPSCFHLTYEVDSNSRPRLANSGAKHVPVSSGGKQLPVPRNPGSKSRIKKSSKLQQSFRDADNAVLLVPCAAQCDQNCTSPACPNRAADPTHPLAE